MWLGVVAMSSLFLDIVCFFSSFHYVAAFAIFVFFSFASPFVFANNLAKLLSITSHTHMHTHILAKSSSIKCKEAEKTILRKIISTHTLLLS